MKIIQSLFEDKKTQKALICLFLISVILIGIVAQIIFDIRNASHGVYDYEDISAYRNCGSDLNYLARYFLSRYTKEFDRCNSLSVILITREESGVNVSLFDYDFQLLSERKDPLNEATILRIINVAKNAFPRKKARFVDIRISRNQVAFTTDGPYSLIYAPQRLHNIGETLRHSYASDYYTSPICPGWYRVIDEI